MKSLDLYSMFLLGLLGTGHCIGMCGPLVFAFPARTGRFRSHLLYHAGRMSTYVGIGAVMGGIGAGLAGAASQTGLAPLVWTARLQVGFSLLAAAFLGVFGLAQLGMLKEPAWMSVASPNRIPGYRKIIESAVVEKSPVAMLLLGLMLGFLPCGLSFAAFARALPAGGPLEGGILVLAFATGTVPGLLLVGTGASGIARRYRRHSDILSGILMIGMAVSLAADAMQAMLR